MRSIERAKADHRISLAAEAAEAVVRQLELSATPIDPVAVARTERPLLKLCPGNYKAAFDGRLEFRQERFYCYYNTKYDEPGRGHAPRTRFSLAHELGHYFVESHHQHLRRGGRPHPSQLDTTAPSSRVLIEKQANRFAADLLMPPSLFRPLANREEATIELVYELASKFDTSLVSTTCQIVQCTDFCTAAAVVHDGELAWVWPSDAMVRQGFYPDRTKKGRPRSVATAQAWLDFCRGRTEFDVGVSRTVDWFNTYGKHDHLPVVEFYAPIPVANELLVLLTVPEDELLTDDDW